VLRICITLKTPSPCPGSNPRPLDPVASILTATPPRQQVGSASRLGRALPPGKEPPVPIVQEVGWAPESVWTQRLEEIYLASAGDRTSMARSSSP
jgi:hypothetical protein